MPCDGDGDGDGDGESGGVARRTVITDQYMLAA
jgi:hypothetical protein